MSKLAAMGDKEFETFAKHVEKSRENTEEHVDQPTKRQLKQGRINFTWI